MSLSIAFLSSFTFRYVSRMKDHNQEEALKAYGVSAWCKFAISYCWMSRVLYKLAGHIEGSYQAWHVQRTWAEYVISYWQQCAGHVGHEKACCHRFLLYLVRLHMSNSQRPLSHLSESPLQSVQVLDTSTISFHTGRWCFKTGQSILSDHWAIKIQTHNMRSSE